jgi:hypothetical protein
MAIPLGSLIWDLEPVVPYVLGQEIPATIYVRNGTTTPQTYKLSYTIAKGTTILSTKDIPVSDAEWFTVNPGDILPLIGTLDSPVNDGVMTLQLTEQVSGSVIDNIQVTITPPGASSLTLVGTPGGTSDMINQIIMFMFIMMMMKMMMGTPKEKKKPEGVTQPAPETPAASAPVTIVSGAAPYTPQPYASRGS